MTDSNGMILDDAERRDYLRESLTSMAEDAVVRLVKKEIEAELDADSIEDASDEDLEQALDSLKEEVGEE